MRENELFDMLCNTGDGVFIVDGNKRIIRWNSGAEKIMKLPEAHVLDRECYQVISGHHSPDKPICGPSCKVHSAAMKGAPQKSFDVISRTGEGEQLWLNISVIASSEAETPFMAHIVRDVTNERKTGFAVRYFLSSLENNNLISNLNMVEKPKQIANEKASPSLSNREIEVLKLLAEGLSTKGLAQKLDISHFTARNHIQNILVKLDLHSKAQAVSYAFKKGIL